MRSRSFVAVACVLLTSGAALLAYVADDAIRTPGGRGANLLNTLNKLVPEALTSAVNRKLQDFGVDVHQPIITSPVDAMKERINVVRRSLMQVGRGGKARGGRRGARSGRGGGGRGAQKRLPELEEWVPSYALREHWPSTTGLNSFAGTQPLPERCKGERLRPADVSHKGPNGSPSGECFQLDLRGKNETQPVLPTLFVPGFPKSATTWLWDCMHAAYLPEVVCRDAARTEPRAFRAGFDPRRWSKAGCSDADGTPRRFMLPGTACNVLGGCQHRKELFFYGGGFGNYFANGLASLHGPELPLEMFANREMAPRGVDRQAYDGFKLRRMGTFCTDPVHTHLPPNRTHPSCCVATSRKPKFWGCRWHDTLRVRHGHSELMWFQTAMPWVKPDAYEFASVDFTPNYLCTTTALHNIKNTALDPKSLRFIVLMRDPIMRAFSEWSMFALGWFWEKNTNFEHKVSQQMRTFRECNTTLFHDVEKLKTIPPAELEAYLTKCFRGRAMEYVSTSVYSVCILNALRVFDRSQFLFLRFEDLMGMNAPALLKLLSNFTGLHTDAQIINQMRSANQCEARSAKKKPLSFTKRDDSNASQAARAALERVKPQLDAFFAPYNELLRELVHPDFHWSDATHAHARRLSQM